MAIVGFALWAFAASNEGGLLAAAIAGPVLALALCRRSLEVSRLALTDQLTGLGNDRHFLERLERDLDRAEVEGETLALCLLDVDDFKRINDRFGHPTGDRALAEIASSLRHTGEAYRLGGDEFALLLYGRDEESAMLVANSIVRRVAAAEYSHGSGVTISAGLAVFPSQESRRSELVRAADTALYLAKADGKNRACAFRPEAGWLPELRRFDAPPHRAALFQAATILA